MMRHTARYETLDHFRGLAALAVIFHHTPLYTYENGTPVSWGGQLIAIYQLGWWGVPAFFAISGYCVVAAADRAPAIGTYFKRRIRRIYPPYLLTLFLVLALSVPLGPVWSSKPYPISSPTALTAWAWLGNLTLTVVWLPRLMQESMPTLLGPAWSLCYEEGYYLIVGLLLLMIGRRWLFAGVIAITVSFFAAQRLGGSVECTPADPYWYGFASGAGAYFCLSHNSASWRRLYGLSLTTVVITLVIRTPTAMLFSLHSTPQAGGVIGGIFAVVLIALHSFDSRLSAVRVIVPLQWCGQRCYSIYLMHWPICKTIASFLHGYGFDEYAVLWPLISLPLSVLAGHIFHIVVERHFLNTSSERPSGTTSSGLVKTLHGIVEANSEILENHGLADESAPALTGSRTLQST